MSGRKGKKPSSRYDDDDDNAEETTATKKSHKSKKTTPVVDDDEDFGSKKTSTRKKSSTKPAYDDDEEELESKKSSKGKKSKPVYDDDEDEEEDFNSKSKDKGRKSQPYVEDEEDDDDEGFSSTKWVPPSQRKNATNKELEDEMDERDDEVTDSIYGLKAMTEQTKGVAGQTLVTLKEQGEQIDRIHHKVVQTDQELQKGEKLLSKLGGIFSFGYKPKKGKAVTGPKDYGDDKVSRGGSKSRGDREQLGLDGSKKKAGKSGKPTAEGMTAMERHEAKKKHQDEVLDDVIDNLDDLKFMAEAMGDEMDRQDKKLDDLTGDVDEVGSRVKQANKRANRLLGKK